MADIQGGFDCEFVEKPPKAVQSNCPVCLLVLREPYQATCCGYSFCRVCIERIQVRNLSCPCCKADKFDVFPNKGLQRSLYDFKVYCTNKNQGCQWKGEPGQLHQHLNLSPTDKIQLEGCLYAQIQCLYCSKLFERSNIKAHQSNECARRPFSCKFCKDFDSYYENLTTNHWPICDCYPVLCPNKCDKSLKRQEVDSHVANDCPLSVVDCDFKHVGCIVMLQRKDLPAHLAESMITHMSLQTASYKQFAARLEEDNRQLKEQVAKLTQDLQALQSRLEEDNRQLQQQVSELQSLVPTLPVEMSLRDFDKHKKNNDVWYSAPFYTKTGGYKMCLKIYANGCGKAKGSYISVFVHMMRGEFDD